LQRLQDDVFGILKRAAPKTLIDERLNFGPGDLNRHGMPLPSLSSVRLSSPQRRRRWVRHHK
jgi:hypothetical protein